jgi:hypothetical protein
MATTPNSALAGLVAILVTGLSPFSRHAVNAGIPVLSGVSKSEPR